jgi:outer membrane protein TolC
VIVVFFVPTELNPVHQFKTVTMLSKIYNYTMKRFTLILSVCLLQYALPAQTVKLSDILDSVQHTYPSLKMYDAEIQSLNAAAKGANNWEPLQVSTGFWMTPYNTKLWKSNGPGTTGMGQYMLSAEQMFPNKKANEATENYMKAMSSVEKENKEAALNELFAAAKKNYYEWMIIEKKLSVLDESEKLLQFIITNAETRYKNGLGKISAYYKAKASLGNIQNLRIDLENEIVQKRIALNTLMNIDKTNKFSIDTNYVIKDYSNKAFDSSVFYSSRSDIKSVDKNIELTILQQNIERAKLKPEYGIKYDHMFGFGGFPMQYTLMGIVKIPMNWSTKSNKANIESLKFKAQSLEEQKTSMANEYTGMAYQLEQDIEAKKKQVALFENNIMPALKKNYESNQLAYQQNTAELFELYDAWETLNNTQLEYLHQLQQLLSLQVDLEKLLQIK